jgi:hypothetical protein
LLLVSVGCDAPPVESPPPSLPRARVADAAVADATATQQIPPGCLASSDVGWSCPDVVLAAAGNQAIVCLRGNCAEDEGATVCMLVDPRSGDVVGDASLPTPQLSEDAVTPPFELFAEGRAVAVCASGHCRQVPNALPPGKHDLEHVVVDERGRRLFVIDGDLGIAYDVASKQRVGRVNLQLPENQPPPPGSYNDLAYWGRGLLLGDFDEPGTIDRALDPGSGKTQWLTKPWARLPGHLLVHFDWDGRIALYDFDASLAVVASGKAGKPRNTGEGVEGYILRIGDDALIVTAVPPATLFVDSKARTISKPRKLSRCRS